MNITTNLDVYNSNSGIKNSILKTMRLIMLSFKHVKKLKFGR